jgi:hypothetical protein
MSGVIENNVDIELLIEGKVIEGEGSHHEWLFEKITKQEALLHSLSHDTINSTQTMETAFDYFEVSQICSPTPNSQTILSNVDTSSIYRVQTSFLYRRKDQRYIERVFEIENLSSKIYFDAFEFKDYIVCPAFLADSYKLTTFACLNVKNGYGPGYAYIFVNKNSLNPLSKILDSDCKILSEYSFKLPLEADKVLSLSFDNKNLTCLLDHFVFGRGNPCP